MPIIRNFSGKATQTDLVRACENVQNTQKAILVHLQGGIDEAAGEDEKFFNEAQFAEVQSRTEIYNELIFVPVEDPNRIPSIIADHLPALLIFDKTLVIEGREQRTLGFGRFE